MYRGCQGDGDGPQFTNLTVSDCSTADWDQIGGATGAWCSINLDKNNNGNYGEIKVAFGISFRDFNRRTSCITDVNYTARSRVHIISVFARVCRLGKWN